MPDEDFSNKKVRYSQGDVLMLYTDGITEAVDARFQQYGDERLISLLAQSVGESSEMIMRNTLNDVQRYTEGVEQYDDMTMLVIRFIRAENEGES
jgi:sigma-B regulation protein RsbU (phosphoserine phosphatase)